MDRTEGANYLVDANGNRIFTDGPPGTTVEERWLTAVQEEIMHVIETAGITPDKNALTQLRLAIQTLAAISIPSADDTGAANAYVVTPSPAFLSYTAYMTVRFKATNANTGASTINVNSLGAKSIKNADGSDLEANQIEAGGIYTVVYDGTNFQFLNYASRAGIANYVTDDYRVRTLKDYFMGQPQDPAVGPLGDLGWKIATATALNIGVSNGENGQGVTANTAGQIGKMVLAKTGISSDGIDPYYGFTAIFRVALNSGQDNFKVKIGFSNIDTDGDKAEADCIYFHLDRAVDANWKAVNSKDTTYTETDTGVVVSSGIHEFKIVRRTTWQDGVSDIRFYINGALEATHTTNVPGPSPNFDQIQPLMLIEMITSVSRSIACYYFYLKQTLF